MATGWVPAAANRVRGGGAEPAGPHGGGHNGDVSSSSAPRPGAPGSPVAALHRLDLASLPTRVRRALVGIDDLLICHVDLVTRFRRVTSRDGLLLHGATGWSEASPFWDYDPAESSRWLEAALLDAATGAPDPVRATVPVNVTVPVSSPQAAAARVRASGGCATAKIKVADPGVPLAQDLARVEAVADALRDTVGGRARLRIDANGAWDPDRAVEAVRELDRAAAAVGGLEYVEQPCPDIEGLAEVRRRVDVPVAADESIRRAEDPLAVARAGAADIAVVKVLPLGGTARALAIAAETGLEVVLSSALETSVGLSTGVRAAAALQHLPHACGLATAQLLAQDVTEPLAPVGGELPVDRRDPDLELLDVRPLPEDLEARWRERLAAMVEHLPAQGGGTR